MSEEETVRSSKKKKKVKRIVIDLPIVESCPLIRKAFLIANEEKEVFASLTSIDDLDPDDFNTAPSRYSDWMKAHRDLYIQALEDADPNKVNSENEPRTNADGYVIAEDVTDDDGWIRVSGRGVITTDGQTFRTNKAQKDMNVRSGEGNIAYVGEERKLKSKARRRRARGMNEDGTFSDLYDWQVQKSKAKRLEDFRRNWESQTIEAQQLKRLGVFKKKTKLNAR